LSINPVTFSAFPTLRGGDDNDTFAVVTNATITANIDGGDQLTADAIDYSLQNIVVVNMGGAFGGITGLEEVIGNGRNSTLNGPLAGEWLITGVNRGEVRATAGGAPLLFSGFNYLNGGSGDDHFTVSGNCMPELFARERATTRWRYA
jgi:hypothetical protein